MSWEDLCAEGPRVQLRPVRDDDAPVLEALSSAVERVHSGESLVICRAGEDDRPIGILEYALGEPWDGWASIRWVALVKAERRWGLGQDAVRLFEEVAGRHGVRAFRTQVPVGLGLALYFWLRLGYRPHDIEGETQRSGTLYMVRGVAG